MLPVEFPLEKDLTEDDLIELANISEGFSGRDIRKAVLLSLAGAAIKNRTNSSNAFQNSILYCILQTSTTSYFSQL